MDELNLSAPPIQKRFILRLLAVVALAVGSLLLVEQNEPGASPSTSTPPTRLRGQSTVAAGSEHRQLTHAYRILLLSIGQPQSHKSNQDTFITTTL